MTKKKSDKVDGTKVVDLAFIGSRDEVAEQRNVISRERIRGQLEEDIQAFLAQGGTIENVAPNVTADPPKKPSNTYGSRPI